MNIGGYLGRDGVDPELDSIKGREFNRRLSSVLSVLNDSGLTDKYRKAKSEVEKTRGAFEKYEGNGKLPVRVLNSFSDGFAINFRESVKEKIHKKTGKPYLSLKKPVVPDERMLKNAVTSKQENYKSWRNVWERRAIMRGELEPKENNDNDYTFLEIAKNTMSKHPVATGAFIALGACLVAGAVKGHLSDDDSYKNIRETIGDLGPTFANSLPTYLMVGANIIEKNRVSRSTELYPPTTIPDAPPRKEPKQKEKEDVEEPTESKEDVKEPSLLKRIWNGHKYEIALLTGLGGVALSDFDGDGFRLYEEINFFDRLATKINSQFEYNAGLKFAHDNGIRDKENVKGLLALEENGIEPDEQRFFDLVEKMPDYVKPSYVRKAVGIDKKLSFRDVHNIEFLETVDQKIFDELARTGKIVNYDLDGDNIDNNPERLMKQPFNIANDTFVIFSLTDEAVINEPNPRLLPYDPINPNGSSFDETRFLLKMNGIDPKKVYFLKGKEATFENFSDTVANVGKEMDENDTLLIELSGGHGGSYSYQFNDSGHSYQKISEVLNQVPEGKIVFSTAGCSSYEDRALDALERGACPRIILAETNLLGFTKLNYGLWREKLARIAPDMDSNKDGLITVLETYNYKKSLSGNYGVRDLHNLGEFTIIGDLMVDELEEYPV